MGFGELCFIHFRVKCKDRSNILGPDWGLVWPSPFLLRYLEATALLLGGKLRDLEGKLGHREVMLKQGGPCYVETICQMLFGHVVGFAEMLSPQQDQDFKWVSASYVGPTLGSSQATLCDVGAILGPASAILGLC